MAKVHGYVRYPDGYYHSHLLYSGNDKKAETFAENQSSLYPYDVFTIVYTSMSISTKYIVNGEWHHCDVDDKVFSMGEYEEVILNLQKYGIPKSCKESFLKWYRENMGSVVEYKGQIFTLTPFWENIVKDPTLSSVIGEVMQLYTQGMLILRDIPEDDIRHNIISVIIDSMRLISAELSDMNIDKNLLDQIVLEKYHAITVVGANYDPE